MPVGYARGSTSRGPTLSSTLSERPGDDVDRYRDVSH